MSEKTSNTEAATHQAPEPTSQAPKKDDNKKRVLVPMDQETYVAIKNALAQFSKRGACFSISFPGLLSRTLKYHWQREVRRLEMIDESLRRDVEKSNARGDKLLSKWVKKP